jgi:hypothetical protein
VQTPQSERAAEELIERYFYLDRAGVRYCALPDKPDARVIKFTRDDKHCLLTNIPAASLSGRVPPNAKAELENFFAHIKSKCGL